MKPILITLLAATAMFAQDRPAQRQKNQQKRIAEGVANEELTKREVKKIESKEKALHKEIVQDRKDGKGLTKKERVKIEAKQDALSKEIAKDKHDKQKQKQ
ncbi:MAG: hypothetical protein HY820_41015 [Acidobacteria bacterium]|nr:hypothetical protein [Acidobacteriota bacterium]